MEKTLVEFKDLDGVVENGKNKVAIHCIRCPSLILNPTVGTYLSDVQMDLPQMRQKKDAVSIETDKITDCFRVDDMYHFENVGFSHQCNDVKYLTCADCEYGPIGWFKDRISYVALSRVRYESSSTTTASQQS